MLSGSNCRFWEFNNAYFHMQAIFLVGLTKKLSRTETT